jgi:hypothetical protein
MKALRKCMPDKIKEETVEKTFWRIFMFTSYIIYGFELNVIIQAMAKYNDGKNIACAMALLLHLLFFLTMMLKYNLDARNSKLSLDSPFLKIFGSWCPLQGNIMKMLFFIDSNVFLKTIMSIVYALSGA